MAIVVKLLLALGEFFIALGRSMGRKEAIDEAKTVHDERVAEALAARADADAIGGLHDPFNRDNRS